VATSESGTLVPAGTPEEAAVAEIWAELLGSAVGLHEDFFASGGDSILAAAVLARAHTRLGAEVTIGSFVQEPTIAALAEKIERAREQAPEPPPAADRSPEAAAQKSAPSSTQPPRCSYAQERFWFIDQASASSAVSNVSWALRLRGALDVAALKRAFTALAARHDSLRTRFDVQEGQPVQVVEPSVEIPVTVVDAASDSEAAELAADEASAPFDLHRGPLLRAALLRLSDEDQVLQFIAHHIVCDDWSKGVIMAELGALYEELQTGETAELGAPAIQYPEYARSQRERLNDAVLDRELEHWKAQLAGAPPELELAGDRPRPPAPTGGGARLRTTLPPGLGSALRQFGRQEGATFFMTMLAAFEALLHRYTGQDDFVVGTAVDNRGRVELESAIGLFTNVLALRADLSGTPSFSQLVARARSRTLDAIAHQELPFDRLAATAPERDPSRHPIFQAFFEFIVPAPMELPLPGIDVEPFEVLKRSAEFDLALYLDEQWGRLDAVWEYSTDLFDAATIERMARHFVALLAGLVTEPDTPVAELPLLDDAERRLALAQWNETTAPVPDGSVVDLFEAQATRAPSAPAVVAGGAELSYGELNARANRIAHLLLELGVRAGDRIGLCADRSADLIAAMLAVLKVGAAYVPLSPDHPPARLVQQLRSAEARLLITEMAVGLELPGFDGRLLHLDAASPRLQQVAATDPDRSVTSDGLAYVLFTSGSTGVPKGVAVRHRNLLNYTSHMLGVLTRDAPASDLHFASVSAVSTDLGNTAIFPALAGGGCLHLVPSDAATDASLLSAYVAAHPIDVLKITPSHLSSLIDADAGLSILPRRWLILGGEALTWELADRVVSTPGLRVLNHYGPTEATIGCCIFEIDPGRKRNPSSTVPIGRPISNTTAYVLDRLGGLAPVGVPGELHIGGAGVAAGYVNQPELTAAVFRTDTFADDPDARLYRTGDVARYLPDGSLEFVGRNDEQVKIRGFRVEPGEVQAALMRESGVRQAAVIAVGQGEGKRLAAYVVGNRPADSLRTALEQALPAYMVPSTIAILDALPLTPSGKLDRRELPSLEAAASASEAPEAEPLTEMQARLGAIWTELLEHEVGIDDNFFEVGGHSLLAIRLVARLRADVGVKLTLKALLDAPTIRELAARVGAMHAPDEAVPAVTADENAPAAPPAEQDEEAPPIAHAPRERPLRCSYAQEQFWLVDQLTPASTAYNFSWPMRLRGPLDVEALDRAVTEIVRRHESLRTSFASQDGVPVQVVQDPGSISLSVVDLSENADPEQAAQSLVDELTQAPFELSVGPLFRMQLLRLGEEEHVLQIVVHHIVFDGVSKVVLYRELGALYEAFAAGREPTPAKMTIQYGDYAEWQRSWLVDERLDGELDYWRTRLQGIPAALDLPTDRPRPPVASLRGARLRKPVPRALREELERVARAEGATFFSALLAAFGVLLYRYTGQDDVIVGAPVDTRTRPELLEVVGPFINTIVLRNDLSGSPSVKELVARVHRRTLDAIEHQELPFERLVEALAPERDLSRHPIFQTLLALNPPEKGLVLPGVDVQDIDPGWSAARVDLFLVLDDLPQGLEAIWEYSTDLFDEETIERMSRHFLRLLEEIVADPSRSIDELALLEEGERSRLLIEWNQTEAEIPQGRLDELIAEQAGAMPERVAAQFDGATLTYGELDARANQLAHRLRALGVGPDDLIGICLPRSEELLIALLGTMKSGGAYVPIDPTYPAERQRFMLADAGVRVLITDTFALPSLEAHDARVLCLRRDSRQLDGEPTSAPEPISGADGLAYVIYTSGSTGRPKGVEISHRALVNFLATMGERPGLHKDDVLVAVTTLSFDIAGLELYLPLISGARVVVASTDTAADPRALARLLAASSATVMQATPTTWRMLLESGWRGKAGFKALCGGEVLPAALANDLVGCGLELWNMYGPTETTIWSMVEPVLAKGQRPSIGRPIANTTLFVLDRYGAPTPVGVPGELHIGGVGVARGYRNRPELSAERFVRDPFSSAPDARLYKTGDLARYRPNGTIEFLGRLDHQIKLRGFRIELGEVETRLAEHPSVAAAAAILHTQGAKHPALVAYVVPAGAPTDGEELRHFLAASLPGYMVPTTIVSVERLPLTPNGKIDRAALPAPDAAGPSATRYVAPRTELEEAIAGLWTDVLGVERVGVEDDFFELGGQSLLAARLIGRLVARFDLELPLRSLFEAPSVAGLAARIEGAQQMPTGGAELAARREEPPPLVALARRRDASFAQERFWFIDQVAGESGAYNISWPLRLRGALDVSALNRALNEIVRRHEILRTRFDVEDGRPVQLIDPPTGVRLEFADLSLDADPGARARAIIDEQTQASFDIAAGPVLRAGLLRLGERDHILQLVVHHIAADGGSKAIFFEELGELYDAFADNRPAQLQELPVQYADFAEWQRSWLQGERLERELAYWTQNLQGMPMALELATDRPRPGVASLRGAWHRETVPAELVESISVVARAHGATLFMALLAAYEVLLYRYSGQEDVIVGVPVDNRSRQVLEQLIGPFVNSIVMRGDLSGSPTFAQLLSRTRRRMLDAREHQELPFERLVEELAPDRHPSRHPLFQAQLTLNPRARPIRLAGLDSEELETAKTTSRVDLTLLLQQQDAGLDAVWEYSTDLFDGRSVEQIARHFERLLASIVADPDRSIDELEMIDQSERAELLAQLPQRRTFEEFTMHSRFEQQVQRSPDAIAVLFEGESLTYRQLNERANQLAHRLRGLGIGRESLVALFLERSLEMVVAVIGVLKAGGAYVPLDPEYPPARVALVLADCAAPVVLAQERLAQRLPESDARVLCIDSDPELSSASAANPVPVAGPQNLAYVIYTSGSTGQPKGVQVEHRQVARLFTATEHLYGFGPDDTWVLAHSYAFDVSVWELWGALAHGGRIVVPAFWVTRTPEAFAALVEQHGVTVLSATPTLFTAVQDELLARADELSLRFVVFAGEALHPSSLRPWFARFGAGGAVLVNMYGITETTVHATYRELRAEDCERDVSPIGVPIPDLGVYLLDRVGAPVPVGVAGELYVGGDGVTRGYLNRPELNAQRFLPNPFGPGRLYRSGDLARLQDGELLFMGRIDDQVKIRGFRIELGEVEAVLDEHPAVHESAVIATKVGSDDVRLAAYAVPSEEMAAPVREMARLMRDGGLSPEQLFELPDGTAIAHLNAAETQVMYEEIFVRGEYFKHGIELPRDACVIDVGANIGLFALFAARRAPNARIFALEPIPAAHAMLTLNARIHGMQLTALDCAAGASAQTAAFTYFPHFTVMSGRYADTGEEVAIMRRMLAESSALDSPQIDELLADRLECEVLDRPVRTISEVIAEYGLDCVDLLKVDAERSELDVLAGIAEDDWPKIRQLVMEVHGGQPRTAEVRASLERLGFGVVVDEDEVKRGSGLYNLYARRQPVATTSAAPAPLKPWRSARGLREDLLLHLQRRLPGYMVPASIAFLRDVPLTTNGKLDRDALPAPDWESQRESVYIAPVTAEEIGVAQLFSELLGVDRVSRDDDFFRLGGHSLLVAQLVSRARARFGGELSVRSVFHARTVAGVARELESHPTANGDRLATAETVPRRAPGERWPLSHSQRQLWMLDQWDPGSPAYNVPLAFRVRGRLDLGALRAALEGVMSRHEALRTLVRVESDEPVPVLLDSSAVELELELDDMTGCSEHEALTRLAQSARRPFDFSRDSLLRAGVVRLGAIDYVLLLQTHHIAFDGLSERILLEEVSALYLGERPPPPPRQFGDFAVWERRRLTAGALDEDLRWWRTYLAGASTMIELPLDRPRTDARRFAGGIHEIALGANVAESIRALCHELAVTPYMIVLATLATLLYRITGEDDILLGSPVANRASKELARVIGFFSNTLVFRVSLRGNPTFRELLGRVREMAIDVYEHQGVPFEKIVEAVAPERRAGINPLFQVNLRVGTARRPVLEVPGLSISPIRFDLGYARFDLALDIDLLEDGLSGYLRYNRDIFEPATIERLAAELEVLLSAAAADPDRQLLSFELRDSWRRPRAAAPSLRGRARGSLVEDSR
jgi:amino acid adenylation domain-containing protein/FkbM family methyltransferase